MTEIKNQRHSIEERLNSMSHSMGAGLSLGGLVFLLIIAYVNGGRAVHYAAFSIYGAFQILMYMSSALLHQFTDMHRTKKVLRIMDQISIYLMIAGTYTPVALIALGGRLGWTVFGLIWGMAVLGILSKVLIFRTKNVFSDLLYLPMGWLIVIAGKPLLALMPSGFILWGVIGGLAYTIGIIFYLLDKFPFFHLIWHFFVLLGSISFYLAFAMYLV